MSRIQDSINVDFVVKNESKLVGKGAREGTLCSKSPLNLAQWQHGDSEVVPVVRAEELGNIWSWNSVVPFVLAFKDSMQLVLFVLVFKDSMQSVPEVHRGT